MGIIKKILGYLTPLNTRGFWVGLIAGFFYFSFIFWWVWDIYPLESLGIHNKLAAALLVFIVFLASVAVTTLFWGLFGFLTEKIYTKRISPALLPLIIAGTFVLTEYFRTIFFSIFWLGNGGAIGPHWPLGNISYLFIDVPIIANTASLWGIYGINFVLFFIISAAIFILLRKNRKVIFIVETALGIASLFLASSLAEKGIAQNDKLGPISVAIIQTNSPSAGFSNQADGLEDFRKKLSLLKEAATTQSRIIVFPEGANFSISLSTFLDPTGIESYFRNLSKNNLLIIDNITAQNNNGDLLSRAAFVDSRDGLVGYYDKRILTMGGEYLPYILKIPLSLMTPGLREQLKSYKEYGRGDGSNIAEYFNTQIKILICSELISPSKARDINSDVIFITGSLAMWGSKSSIQDQIPAMVRFRAIENGKYTVMASNSGSSYIINPLGKIEKTSNPDTYELLTGNIVPNKGRTWYNYVGDWPILLVSSVFFMLGLRKIRNDETN